MEEDINDTWYKNIDKNAEVINIPEGVTTIPYRAFSECTSLREIDIPNSVISIGNAAFYGCTSLKEIKIPNSVISIADLTFSKCTSLREIDIPNSVSSIGNAAFYKCTSLREIDIPNSVSSIDKYAFSNCESLEKIKIPDNVTNINDNTFIFCKSLKEVIFSNNILSIGNSAFYGCKSLEEINIPNNVSIEGSAFCSCDQLRKITFSSDISIEKSAFVFCESLKEINIKYKNKEELINFINTLSNIIYKKDLNISFIGPTLSVIDKLKISSIVKKQIGSNATISFDNMENEKTPEEEIELVDVSNDIAEVVEKINRIKEIINKLPIDVRNLFIEKTNELLSVYEINRKKEENSLKPVFGENNTMPNLTLESNVNAKMELVLGLDLLLYKLSNSELYLSLITELNGYQELASQAPNEYDHENNGIEGMVKNISYIANKMDESNKNYILKKLNELLNEPRIKYEMIVNSRINDKIELTTDSSLSPKHELIQKLSAYLNEVKSLYNLSRPYTEMLDGFKKDNAENKININSISSTIETIKYVLSTLDRTDEVIELEKEIDRINKEYEELIISRLKSKKVSTGDYKELEKEYRTKLQPLLERLNSIVIKDAHFKDLRQKLTTSREMVSEEKIIDDDSKSVIESFTIEIHNKIINSNLTLSDKESLLEKIKSFINSKLESLDTLNDKDKDEIEKKFNTEFAGLLLDVNNYITKLNEHQSKIKENSAIDEALKNNIKSI